MHPEDTTWGVVILQHFSYNYRVIMKDLEFDWDKRKAAANKKKHGISFEEAMTVFYDSNARHMSDPDHSEKEDRFVLLGMSARLRILVVCHCYRKSASMIRIISARKATKQERITYEMAL
jgi:uncharacterized DUF497 family protein